jgi:hypothetical protein
MKKQITKILTFLTLILFLVPGKIVAQDIEVIYHETTIYQPPGTEIVFDIEIVNISTLEQIVYLVRTINDLPSGLGWVSSLCFGENCYAPHVDTVWTSGVNPFPPPLQPDDTLEASVHVITQNNVGTAYVQVQIWSEHNPGAKTILDYTATTDPTVDVEDEVNLSSYKLEQNYPNPFNPSTNIKFGLREAGFVSLKIYDVLGNEVADLVNEHKPAGNFEVNFESNHLSSGIYIYRLVTNNFSETRKMILEK